MSGVPNPSPSQGGPCYPTPSATLSPGGHPWPHTLTLWLPQNTPDEDFILDRHPKFSNIIVGAGFSGRQEHSPPAPQSWSGLWGCLCPHTPVPPQATGSSWRQWWGSCCVS